MNASRLAVSLLPPPTPALMPPIAPSPLAPVRLGLLARRWPATAPDPPAAAFTRAVAWLLLAWLPATVASAATIDFGRDIRPLLSDACFACHGPDETHRQADLQLHLEGSHAIVPGDAQASELFQRLISDDPDLRMPPPELGKTLTPQQIESIRQWIDQGAEYQPHWAFTLPVQPPLPTLTWPATDRKDSTDQGDSANPDTVAATTTGGSLANWPRQPIDWFVLERLQQRDWSPSPQAAPTALLRRLHLDVTGLPPSPAEVQRFLDDPSPQAYAATVDRLLNSVAYGERWGRVWLDAARYADSDGFEKDKPRFVWPYRDWVVRSLNDDLPYDQFLIKQLAGDLLPNATQDDHIATGFLRNSMINEEGGADPEQFRVEALFDRMDAIGKAMLGLTLQCAQCHTHKFDPLTHDDYFSLFAFLNSCDEASLTVYSDSEQLVRQAVIADLQTAIDSAFDQTDGLRDQQQEWEQSIRQQHVSNWQTLAIDFNTESTGGQRYLPLDDDIYLAAGYAPTKSRPFGDIVIRDLTQLTALRLEMLNDPNLPHSGPGRSTDGTWALSEWSVQHQVSDGDGNVSWKDLTWSQVTASNDLPESDLPPQYSDRSDNQRTLGPVAFAVDGNDLTAWHGDAGPGRRNDPQTALFILSEPLVPQPAADGDQPEIRLRVRFSQMHGGWNSNDNQSINLGCFRVSGTDDNAPAIPSVPPRVLAALAKERDHRSQLEQIDVAEAFLRQHASQIDTGQVDTVSRLEQAWRQHPLGTSQLVLAQRPSPRITRRLDRGDFQSPREVVTAALPPLLNPTDQSLPENPSRLDLARWIASPGCPTTARSIVNRVWQEYFGTGISATSDDLGLQGEPPTHPELLDYLAVDLMDNGWSLKRLHRQILLSATYQQDSAITAEQFEADPDNRYLARGPRGRVSAEIVRDIALSASGLLSSAVGGPPVYPPAPDFLFQPPASYGLKAWATSSGSDRYRRALYTFRFRSVPHPLFEAFDAPNGDVSCVRRPMSNTPLQALVTLNEPLFLECAQALGRTAAQLAARDPGDAPDPGNLSSPRAAIEHAFLRCTSRLPDPQETDVLLQLLDEYRQRFAAEPELAAELVGARPLETDSSPTAEQLPAAEQLAIEHLAAWTVVCRVILNLDETITKP